MICDKCKSTKVIVTECIGRGITPKNYTSTGKRVSWKGIWQIFKCECGNEWKKLKS